MPTKLGQGSPVTADSSMEADASRSMPSTGSNSPARTSSSSPTATWSTGMSSIRSPTLAVSETRVRSVKAFRSRWARPRAKSSSTLPPEYMIATTTAARDSPRASAADMETSAMASTPTRPIRKSRRMDIASATTTGTAAAAQMRPATLVLPEKWTTPPATRPAKASPRSARRYVVSFTPSLTRPSVPNGPNRRSLRPSDC